jgi:hypothetical protein
MVDKSRPGIGSAKSTKSPDALAPARVARAAPVAVPARSDGDRREWRRRDPLPVVSLLKGMDLWSAFQRLSALEKDLQQIQPQLALKPLKLANQILVVTAGSSAIAARLRQFEPSLVEGLRARGWLVGRIRFRPIAVHDIPPPPRPRTKEPVSGAVLSGLETLEATEMNGELKAALTAFVRRQRSYR